MKMTDLCYPLTNIPDGNCVRKPLLLTETVASILSYDFGNTRIPEKQKNCSPRVFISHSAFLKEPDSGHPKFAAFEANFLKTIQSQEAAKKELRIQTYNTHCITCENFYHGKLPK